MLPQLSVALGGAASGKSAVAENMIISSGLNPVYIATGQAFDGEMETKINLHKARRGPAWRLEEAAGSIAPALATAKPGEAVLLDCATMWLSNKMLRDEPLAGCETEFLRELGACTVPLLIVTNEVGQGIVPDNAMSRAFREAQGRLNIAIAAKADLVVQVVAGLPIVLKGKLP